MDKDNLKLELPLLSGFAYPISAMNYTITLPGEFTSTPDFYSTYQQNGLASELNLLYNGNMLTGSSKSDFNDHESVYMTMTLSPDMFPGVSTYQRTGNPELVPMGILQVQPFCTGCSSCGPSPPGGRTAPSPPRALPPVSWAAGRPWQAAT